MGTCSRLRYVLAANVNALLEKAENPEKLLRALIREMEEASEEAREASVELLAEERRLERDQEDLVRQIGQWRQRAERAVSEDRDDLARAALQARLQLEEQHAGMLRERESVAARMSQMEQDMRTLKGKLAEAKSRLKQSQGNTPHRPASVVHLSRGERRMQQALGRFERLQAQIDKLEARVRSYDIGGPPASAWAPAPVDQAVEEELQRLKERLAGTGEAMESSAAGPGAAREA